MNTQPLTRPRDQARAALLSRRRDMVTAEIVNKGIALQEVLGTKYAAEFLRIKLVDVDVATRVLLRPGERRTY